MKSFFYVLILVGFYGMAYSQNPSPAKDQDRPVLISNATIHVGNGQVISNGAVAFNKGKIVAVGDASKLGIDVAGYDKIDAQGKDVYPGFIALNTILGLSEIEAVRATNDYYEVGGL
jgi:imidazolonepropionase-like amidohydrolase